MRANLTPSKLLSQVLTSEFQARFWIKIEKRGPDECWLWTAAKTKGYGAIGLPGFSGKVVELAHRAAWMIYNRKQIPKRKPLILHSCIGNPGCCNPFHLRPGNNKENAGDMMSQGRGRFIPLKGESNGSAKLSSEKVIELRWKYDSGEFTKKILMAEFNIGHSMFWNITRRKNWTHI